MKSLGRRAADALVSVLKSIPAISEVEIAPGPDGIDFAVHIHVFNRPHKLLCEVKSSGQPRYVRMAVLQLRNIIAHQSPRATPVILAPYLSREVQDYCSEQKVGFLDLEGNARITIDGLFVERQVDNKPPPERRELKGLFKPKSARVLRLLLKDPKRAWKVTELAQEADVSLGQVSKIRTALINREWARASSEGLVLSEPNRLLDSWRTEHSTAGLQTSHYSTLHGKAFEEALRQASQPGPRGIPVVLASFSAAQWLAPFGRTGSQYVYASEDGIKRLQGILRLSSPTKGENVIVTIPRDEGVFRDAVEPAPGIYCTSPVQTYLDLFLAGERGKEAAEHLRREKLAWLEN